MNEKEDNCMNELMEQLYPPVNTESSESPRNNMGFFILLHKYRTISYGENLQQLILLIKQSS